METLEKTKLEDFEVCFLDATQVKLFRTSPSDVRVRMTLDNDRSWISVQIARAFPFSNPEQYIGLRDGADKDIGIITNLSDLDGESQKIVEIEMERRYFTPNIKKVTGIFEQHGTVTMLVDTDRGNHRIVIRNLRDNSFRLGPNRLMVIDSEGNRYHFQDITKYGRKAYEVFAKVL